MITKQELKKLFEEGLIDKDKFKDELFKLDTTPKIKRVGRKLPTFLTPEEFVELIKATKKEHHKLAYLLAFESGLRISEVLKLTKNDVDIPGKRIKIVQGKGGKDRIVPLPKRFKTKYLAMLPIKCGGRSLEQAFRRHCEYAKLLEKKPGLHFHSLRHSFCTHCIRRGMKVELAQMLMGHASINTTMLYTHLSPDSALRAYEEAF